MLNCLTEAIKKYYCLWLVLAMAYIAVCVIALYTPMHSDDFRYATLGLDFDKHLYHYLNWSGRVVADYVSTLIFSLENRVLIALVNSLGTVLLVYNIAALPRSIDKTFSVNKVALLSVLIFFTYWIASPNLGQVMFWVVGSANYLWTTLAIIYFLRKIILYQDTAVPLTS